MLRDHRVWLDHGGGQPYNSGAHAGEPEREQAALNAERGEYAVGPFGNGAYKAPSATSRWRR